MNVTDPIADMLTRIRNSIIAGHSTVAMPSSKMKASIAQILSSEGFIEGYEVADDERTGFKVLRLRLKYVGERRQREPVITELERVSKPGRRVYVKKTEIPWVLSGLGRHCFDPQRGHDRAARAPAGRRWRAAVQGLVTPGRSGCGQVARQAVCKEEKHSVPRWKNADSGP